MARRNAFIYKHRDLPIKELVQLVYDKFEDLMDYTYLHKIIAEQDRKNSVPTKILEP